MMVIKVLILLALPLTVAVLSQPLRAAGPTGLEIMETQRRLHRPEDEEELRLMIMVDESVQERRRKLAGYMITSADDRYRLLLRFRAPRDVRNTGLLVWENETGVDASVIQQHIFDRKQIMWVTVTEP